REQGGEAGLLGGELLPFDLGLLALLVALLGRGASVSHGNEDGHRKTRRQHRPGSPHDSPPKKAQRKPTTHATPWYSGRPPPSVQRLHHFSAIPAQPAVPTLP